MGGEGIPILEMTKDTVWTKTLTNTVINRVGEEDLVNGSLGLN